MFKSFPWVNQSIFTKECIGSSANEMKSSTAFGIDLQQVMNACTYTISIADLPSVWKQCAGSIHIVHGLLAIKKRNENAEQPCYIALWSLPTVSIQWKDGRISLTVEQSSRTLIGRIMGIPECTRKRDLAGRRRIRQSTEHESCTEWGIDMWLRVRHSLPLHLAVLVLVLVPSEGIIQQWRKGSAT